MRPVGTVLVTGAANGIGCSLTTMLESRGHAVVAADLPSTSFPARSGPLSGGRIHQVTGDVTRPEDNQRFVDVALQQFGSLDAVALNAGVTGRGGLEEQAMDEVDRTWDVNVRGVVLGLRSVLPALRASTGSRSVVVTASVSGLGGDPLMWAYNASKAAAVNLVRAAALDLGPEGIRINAVCPGPTRTGMTDRMFTERPSVAEELQATIPLQRWAQPDEVAEAIAFLLSSASSFITGVALPVDGGVTASTGQFRPGTNA